MSHVNSSTAQHCSFFVVWLQRKSDSLYLFVFQSWHRPVKSVFLHILSSGRHCPFLVKNTARWFCRSDLPPMLISTDGRSENFVCSGRIKNSNSITFSRTTWQNHYKQQRVQQSPRAILLCSLWSEDRQQETGYDINTVQSECWGDVMFAERPQSFILMFVRFMLNVQRKL